MVTPEDRLGIPKTLYDFEVCIGTHALRDAIAEINQCGCKIVIVTQDPVLSATYTVFFERSAYG